MLRRAGKYDYTVTTKGAEILIPNPYPLTPDPAGKYDYTVTSGLGCHPGTSLAGIHIKHSVRSLLGVLPELVKIKITVLVSLTTGLGWILAADSISLSFLWAVAGIFLLACGSAALNQYQEQNTDLLMDRTKNRPIPSGRISRNRALWISLSLLAIGSAILLAKTNIGTLVVGLLTFYWYNGVYTPLKKITALAIIPGSLVGALPPLAGWLAAGGNIFDIKIAYIAFYFFVWQIPHFWLLLLIYGEDFRKGGFPVLTQVYSSAFIRRATFTLLVLTLLIGSAMPLIGVSIYFASSVMIVGASLIMFFVSVNFVKIKEPSRKDILRTFIAINLYTLALISILSADKLLHLLFNI